MKWVVGALIANVVILNVLVAWRFFNNQSSIINNQTNKTEFVDKCGEECKAEIAKIISNNTNIKYPIITNTPVSTAAPTKTPVIVNKVKVRTVSYVTVPGSGLTALTDWQTLSGTDFYFDTADYPGLIQVTFEANMKLYNGSGRAYLRLFDTTHGIGVQGSDVNNNSNSDIIVESGKIYFWAGKNLIRVQAKSETVETAVFSSGRLRLVVEN